MVDLGGDCDDAAVDGVALAGQFGELVEELLEAFAGQDLAAG